MFAKPQAEHQWLERLLGRWSFTSDCQMGPDQPPVKSEGRVAVRSLGGLWVVLENEGDLPEGGAWSSIMTLGYDPARRQFVGTFVASMMTHLWTYTGALDEGGNKLVLDAEGPGADGNGTARYQDIIEIVDDGHWTLSSQILGDDGRWQPFMSAHHHRRQ